MAYWCRKMNVNALIEVGGISEPRRFPDPKDATSLSSLIDCRCRWCPSPTENAFGANTKRPDVAMLDFSCPSRRRTVLSHTKTKSRGSKINCGSLHNCTHMKRKVNDIPYKSVLTAGTSREARAQTSQPSSRSCPSLSRRCQVPRRARGGHVLCHSPGDAFGGTCDLCARLRQHRPEGGEVDERESGCMRVDVLGSKEQAEICLDFGQRVLFVPD